ncbi:hypothetical protein B0H16DRAFT_1884180 [Mycena metata]|uniref:Uncharacterized protein n=1 Tax=Mycena metata TaxID=1033252 RepID=A0AAD7NH89_9AGAR|nr:hypothetical protein B0H16DRAFT_1884180 [Mycena metata]
MPSRSRSPRTNHGRGSGTSRSTRHSSPRRSLSRTRRSSSSARSDRDSQPPRRGSSRAPNHSSSSARGRDSDDDDEVPDFKAAYFALKASNEIEAVKKRKRGPGKTVSTQAMGRGIRMLAVLFGEISTTVTDAEAYIAEGRFEEDDFDEFSPDLSDEQLEHLAERRECERNLVAYKQILRLVPGIQSKLEGDPGDLIDFYAQLQKGANDSRSENVGTITKLVASWINADRDRPDIAIFDHTPAILTQAGESVRQYAHPLFEDRGNRGDDICGGLLTCIEHDWTQEDFSTFRPWVFLKWQCPFGNGIAAVNGTRGRAWRFRNIRDGLRDSSLAINQSFYCRVFYLDFQGDPENVAKGFLQSRYMVKGYKAVFTCTGPASAKLEEFENIPPEKRLKTATGRRSTRKPPCDIFHMGGKVTPRSIAYIAVILHFSLTNAAIWTSEYYKFSYPQMYNFIVDYFEAPRVGTPQRERADKVLDWWNRQIFPNHAVSASTSRTAVSSMAKLRAQQ